MNSIQPVLLLTAILMLPITVCGQNEEGFPLQTISLDNLEAFQPTGANWKIVGGVRASIYEQHQVDETPGTGILLNRPDADHKSQLFFNLEHGDLDFEFEFMMPKGSNSGLYLQGRYEIQLMDSWGKRRASFGDLGGIYERWDDQKPDGQQGFEGTPPQINAAKAPGLWQSMRISFEAPRFDDNGHKTRNARIIFIELNGIVIHRNVELTGPTRGNYVPGEGPTGPLVLQGDHGPIAIRNIRYRSFLGQPAQIKDIHYQVVRQPRSSFDSWSAIETDARGVEDRLTWEVAKTENNFSLLYKGTIEVPKTGKYSLHFSISGQGRFVLNDQEVFPMGGGTRTQMLTLTSGKHPFELEYTKSEPWLQGRLGLEIAGEDFRPIALNYPSSNILGSPVNPIFVKPEIGARHLRSFSDFQMPHMQRRKRITNAINIGDPTELHYTYDLKQGSLVRVWKGDFLNATPMWNNRGNGVSTPMGPVLQLTPNTQIMSEPADGKSRLTFADGAYQYKSYKIDEHNRPTFYYSAYGMEVSDRILPEADRKGFQRQLQFSGQADSKIAYVLAEGTAIQEVQKGLYTIDDARFYIKTDAPVNVRSLSDERRVLVFDLNESTELSYQIIW